MLRRWHPDRTVRRMGAGLLLAVGLPAALAAAPAAARTLVVDQAHSRAADTNDGTAAAPLKTINAAAQMAQPGDTVLVHAGVYRQRVAPARGGEEGKPIVYEAAEPGKVFIKGSDLWKPKWRPVPGQASVYAAAPDPAMFRTGAPKGAVQTYNPYRIELQGMKGYTLGQVFVGGQRLIEATSDALLLATPGSWQAKGAEILVHFPAPAGKPDELEVELTVRGRIFAPYTRGLGHIHVRGFIMEHCGNNFHRGFYAGNKYPQAGALGCRGGHHWVIENNVVRWAKTTGIDVGREGKYDLDGLGQPEVIDVGHHLIRGNLVSDNGAAGIVGLGSLRTKIIGNVIQRNNHLSVPGPETAGVKLHFYIGGLIEGNLFRDNETYGLWLDNVWAHTRVTRNVFLGNREAGVFFEMGGGPALFDNNVVAMTRNAWHASSGLYAHDAGGVTVAHNLFFFNPYYAIQIRVVTGRTYSVWPKEFDKWTRVQSTGRRKCLAENWTIRNNIILDHNRGAISMPLPGPKSQNNSSDYNWVVSGWLNFVPFVANSSGGEGDEQVWQKLNAAYERAGVPPDKRLRPPSYQKGPLLTFEQWRLLGQDTHSQVPRITGQGLLSRRMELTFSSSEEPAALGCRPVPGVDRDFLGHQMPKQGLKPGPFQDVRRGSNHWYLWPVPGVEPPPYVAN